MLPYIQQNRKNGTSYERMKKHMAFHIVTILIISGILILILIVLSVASCKEELKLEAESKALQESRDSLQEQLIVIPPVPASPAPTIEGMDMTEEFHYLFPDIN